jgi:hypothetical protein
MNSSPIPATLAVDAPAGWARRLWRGVQVGMLMVFLAGVIITLGCLYLCMAGSTRLARRSAAPASPESTTPPYSEVRG